MKERGMGEMKILQHKTTNLCRISMRHEQGLKLCSAIDFSDDEAKEEIFCVRFKSSDQTKRFVQQFNEIKQANANIR
ncbi:unnamed protein product, partial [Rotaria sp. Silwood2]